MPTTKKYTRKICRYLKDISFYWGIISFCTTSLAETKEPMIAIAFTSDRFQGAAVKRINKVKRAIPFHSDIYLYKIIK